MRWLVLLFAVVGVGCNCGTSTTPDAGEAPPQWPDGALLTISATTIDTATLEWPAATRANSYRLSVEGQSDKDAASPMIVTALRVGDHRRAGDGDWAGRRECAAARRGGRRAEAHRPCG
jgi:hypothetical protein